MTPTALCGCGSVFGDDMPQGLQVFDANGNVILDTSSFAARFLGSWQSPSYRSATSGTIQMVGLSGSQPFYFASLTFNPTTNYRAPYVTLSHSGETLTWRFYSENGLAGSFFLIWGAK